MKRIWLDELSRNNSLVMKHQPKAEVENCVKELANIIFQMCRMGREARKEGLLYIEGMCRNDPEIRKLPLSHKLEKMAVYVTDGMDEELLAEITERRYFSNEMEGFAGLVYILYREAMLLVRRGSEESDIRSMLYSMVWDDVEEEAAVLFNAEKEEATQEAMQKADECWKQLYGKSMSAEKESMSYKAIDECDYSICNMFDEDLQRVLREINHPELAYIVKAVSGEAVKALHNNLSKRTMCSVYEYYMRIEEPDEERIDGAVRIFNRIVRLLSLEREIRFGHRNGKKTSKPSAIADG